MRHPTSRVLFAYWDTLRGERASPERGEIEPGAIRHVLADTFILDTDGAAPIVRLAGTRLCALFGRELRGEDFTRLWDGMGRADIERLLRGVMDETTGLVGGLVGTTEAGDEINLEMLLLPLRHHGKTHARLLGAISPATIPVWLGARPVEHLRTLSLRMIAPRLQAAEQPLAPVHDPAIERRRRLVVHPGGRA